MMTIQDKRAFSDVSMIIKMMPLSMQKKINPNFIKFLNENKDKHYISSIDTNTPIRDQNLNEETKTLLALIYRDYLCSKDERTTLINSEKEELLRIEEEQQKKYEINFDKRKKSIEDTPISNSIVLYKKENLITKIFNKLKKIFHI